MDTPAELRGLIHNVLLCPLDGDLRAVLADWLEDHQDPRLDLVRLVPALLDTPVRKDPIRPDVSVRRYLFGHYFRTDRKEWPRLTLERTPYGHPSQGHLFDPLGRLFLQACLQDLGISQKAQPRLADFLARCWLCNCRLLPAAERDVGWQKTVSRNTLRCKGEHTVTSHRRIRSYERLHQYLNYSVSSREARVLWACRSGAFNSYKWALDSLLADIRATEFTVGWQERIRNQQAVRWSRFLDLHDTFARVAPWGAMRRIFALRKLEEYKRSAHQPWARFFREVKLE